MLNKDTVFQMLRFGITGATATVVHYGVYYLLMNVINISVAFSVGYLVSFVLNYFMSARFTFRKKTSKKNGAGFCLAHQQIVEDCSMWKCSSNLSKFCVRTKIRV